MARYGKKSQETVKQAMEKMKKGKLKSGRSGKTVRNPRQAVAIGLSEARQKGAKVPPKKTASSQGANPGPPIRSEDRMATKGDISAKGSITTDHTFIQKWVEGRKGKPARVKGTGGRRDPGMLRIDFPGYGGGQSLEQISWEDFFDKFEENHLAFLYQEKTATGRTSRFNKLVSRELKDQ